MKSCKRLIFSKWVTISNFRGPPKPIFEMKKKIDAVIFLNKYTLFLGPLNKKKRLVSKFFQTISCAYILPKIEVLCEFSQNIVSSLDT